MKNKADGFWTYQKCLSVARSCGSISQFKTRFGGAYSAARRNGWIPAIRKAAKFPYGRVPNGLITLEYSIQIAKKYKNTQSLRKYAPEVYNKCSRMGWLKSLYDKSGLEKQVADKWTFETCLEKMRDSESLEEFRTNYSGAYSSAWKNGWLDELCSISGVSRRKQNGHWTYQRCELEAKKYKSRSELSKKSPGAYQTARSEGWLPSIYKAASLRNKTFQDPKQMVLAIKKWARDNGRSPTLRELESVPGLPSPKTIYKYFGSYERALALAGLQPNRVFLRDRVQMISEIKRVAKKIKSTPSEKAFLKHTILNKSVSAYRRMFGSWNQAIEAAGLEIKQVRIFNDKKFLIAQMKGLYKKLGHPPTAMDIYFDPDAPSRRAYVREFGSFDRALKAAGIPEYDISVWRRWQTLCEDIAEHMYGKIERQSSAVLSGYVDIYVEHRRLMIDAMTRAYTGPQKESQVRRYQIPGCQLQFWCLKRGRELKDKNLKYLYPEDLISALKKTKGSDSLIKRISTLQSTEGGFYTKEIIKERIREMQRLKGRIPKTTDFKTGDQYFPSMTTIYQFYSSFGSALKAAKIIG
jgi:hypothetical protein